MCVVGYRFNSEDNHVNAIIADWLRKDSNKMIYLNFDGDLKWNKLLWAEPFVRKEIRSKDITQSICQIESLLTDECNIIDCFIDKYSSNAVFGEIVKLLKNKTGGT